MRVFYSQQSPVEFVERLYLLFEGAFRLICSRLHQRLGLVLIGCCVLDQKRMCVFVDVYGCLLLFVVVVVQGRSSSFLIW